MGSKKDIIPITRGERKPKQGWFAVITGSTRVDIGIEPAQPLQNVSPAVVELINKQCHTEGTPDAPASNRINNSRESNQ
jgi:hypothetical protein